MLTRTTRVSMLLAALWISSLSAAVPTPVGPVSDRAAVLDDGLQRRIERDRARLEAADVRLEVATLETAPPAGLAAWAGEAFEARGLDARSRGLLVVLTTRDRRIHVERGRALDERLPDSLLRELVERRAMPALSQDRWGEGLAALTDALAEELTGLRFGSVEQGRAPVPARAVRPPPAPARPASAPDRARRGGVMAALAGLLGFLLDPRNAALLLAGIWTLWALSLPLRHIFVSRAFLVVGGVIALYSVGFGLVGQDPGQAQLSLLVMVLLGAPAALYTLSRRCPRCGAGYVEIEDHVLREASYHTAGIGQEIRDCPLCNYHDASSYTLARRGGSTVAKEPASEARTWNASPGWSGASSSPSEQGETWSGGTSSFGGRASGGGGAGRSY